MCDIFPPLSSETWTPKLGAAAVVFTFLRRSHLLRNVYYFSPKLSRLVYACIFPLAYFIRGRLRCDVDNSDSSRLQDAMLLNKRGVLVGQQIASQALGRLVLINVFTSQTNPSPPVNLSFHLFYLFTFRKMQKVPAGVLHGG